MQPCALPISPRAYLHQQCPIRAEGRLRSGATKPVVRAREWLRRAAGGGNHRGAPNHVVPRDDLPVGRPRDLPDRRRWPKLAAIGWAISDTMRDGKHCYEMRYYIMSKKLSARTFATAVRSHWSIENCLHWQLDVTFQEDQSRLRRGHADANFSILRRTALSLLKNNHTLKVGVKNKRLVAA